MTGRRSTVDGTSKPTIFAAMTQLAQETGAVNLGQGFPDDDAPEQLLETATAALRSGRNQYPPGAGIPELRQAIASHHRRFYDLELADQNILVTMGATEAIAASVLAFVRPGDEVVMFEPYYDSYAAMVELAGGVRRTIPLTFPATELDEATVRAAFSERTSVLLLNTPHNPTGKVFTAAELEMLGRIAAEHDVVVLCDEVYEHLTFDGREHVTAGTVASLADRTLTISSAGKTFNVTGWKIGWLCGPEDLITAVMGVKQFLTFAGAAPLQPAVARGLQFDSTFFDGLCASMQRRRDVLADGLTRAGFTVEIPQGGYFVLADAAPLGATSGNEFALSLPRQAGVVAIPASAFCDDAARTGMETVMRFAFCKNDATITSGIDRLIHTFGG